jgi:hypothetical protein
MLSSLARPNGEFLQAHGFRRLHINFRDTGRWRRLCFQLANKGFQPNRSPFEMNLNALFHI